MQVERSDIVQLRYFTNGVHSPLPYAVWVKRPTEPIKNYDVLSGYAGGEMVFKDNKLYKSNNATPPGWIDVDWDEQLPYISRWSNDCFTVNLRILEQRNRRNNQHWLKYYPSPQ